MSKSECSSHSIGFLGMLAILFIGLKLGEVGIVARWSWWWVMSPLWLPLAILLVIAAIGGMLMFIVSVVEKLSEKTAK